MPIQPNYPGVYVQEEPSGVHTITGVSTSVALFVGRTEWGKYYDKPVLCLSYSDFERKFSTYTNLGDLPRAVKLFFSNGGSQCYVIRLETTGQTFASFTVPGSPGNSLTITALYKGSLGRNIWVKISYPPGDSLTFNMDIYLQTSGGTQKGLETWKKLSTNETNAKFLETFVASQWVTLDIVGTERPAEGTYNLNIGGSDGAAPDQTDYEAAYHRADKEIDIFNLLILPYDSGIAARILWDAAAEFCGKRRAFLIMDPPPAGWTDSVWRTSYQILKRYVVAWIQNQIVLFIIQVLLSWKMDRT